MSNSRTIQLEIIIPENTEKNVFYRILPDEDLNKSLLQPGFMSINGSGEFEFTEILDRDTDKRSETFILPITLNINPDENLSEIINKKLIEMYGEGQNLKKNLRLQFEKQGIFSTIIFKEIEQKEIEKKAREMLEKAEFMTKRGFRKIFFIDPTDEYEAKKIKKAYQRGERVTYAIKNNTPQAKLFAEMERLLETEEFSKLRTFYIAPISINKYEDESPNEVIVQSELAAIEELLNQGHAVFCLTDTSGKLSEKITPALTLTAEKFAEFGRRFPSPIELSGSQSSTLKESIHSQKIEDEDDDESDNESDLNDIREDLDSDDEDSPPGSQPFENPNLARYIIEDYPPSFDEAQESSEDHSLPGSPFFKEDTEVHLLFSLLEDYRKLSTWPLNLQDHPNLYASLTALDKEKIFNAITIAQKQSFLIEKIKELYEANLTEDQKDKLRQINSGIPTIGDADFKLSLEMTQFATKYQNKLADYLQTRKVSGFSDDPAAPVNRIKLANILHGFLGNNLNNFNFVEIIDSVESYTEQLRGSHSKLQPILSDIIWEGRLLKKRINKIENPTILDSSQVIEPDDKALDTIKHSSSRLWQFSTTQASKLLEYVNQRTNSWSYKSAINSNLLSNFMSDSYLKYTKIQTHAHIGKAQILAQQLLNAKTQDDLHSVILEASAYKNLLLKDEQSKSSDLIKVIDSLEKAFKLNFKNRPLLGPKPIDQVWREEFGSSQYMNRKIRSELQEYKQIINKNNTYSYVDILMSDENLQLLQDYFNLIKEKWNSDDLSIGTAFHQELNSRIGNKTIHDLEFSDMLKSLFKTIPPDFDENLLDINYWSETEKAILGNLAIRAKDISVYLKNAKTSCDLYFIDKKISQEDLRAYNPDANFSPQMNDYKNILAQRILPCLIDANKNHPEGFVLTTRKFDDTFLPDEQFSILLEKIINENRSRLENLKGVIITRVTRVNEPKKLNGIFYIETQDNTELAPQLNKKIYSKLDKNKSVEPEKYFTVALIEKDRLSHPANFIVKKDQTEIKDDIINTNTNLATRISGAAGTFDNREKKYTPIDTSRNASQTPTKSWYNEFYIENGKGKKFTFELNVVDILADIVKPESYLQKRAYQLLTQSMDENIRRVCMCAVTDALAASKFKSNKMLGKRLQEKIGPHYLETMKNKYPSIYYAQLCLAQFKEKEMTELKNMSRLGFKGKLILHLNEFLRSDKSLPELYDTLKNICNDIDKTSNTFYNRFFINNKNLKLKHFIEQFNHFLEKEPELSHSNKKEISVK